MKGVQQNGQWQGTVLYEMMFDIRHQIRFEWNTVGSIQNGERSWSSSCDWVGTRERMRASTRSGSVVYGCCVRGRIAWREWRCWKRLIKYTAVMGLKGSVDRGVGVRVPLS